MKILRIALFFGLTAVLAGAVGAQEMRTWSDSTGRYKIEGKFVDLSGGKVTIERPDGSKFEIEISKLSQDDRKFAAEQAANPFRPAEDNPFKPKTGGGQPMASVATGSAGAARAVTPNWAGAETVALMPTESEWKMSPPIAAPTAPERKARSIPLPPKKGFFEGVKGLAVNHTGQRALVGYGWDQPKPLGETRVVLCDLVLGKVLTTATVAGQMVPLALSDNGYQALMCRDEWGFGNHDRVELWTLSPSGVSRTLEWFPYGDAEGGNRDVKWAAFLDEERLVTLGGAGKLVVWKAQEARPLYHLTIDGGSTPALTPDRKFLVFSTGKQVGVLDVDAAQVVAMMSTPQQLTWAKLCLSPDATRLACLSHDKLYVWNFANGELYRDTPLTGQGMNGEIIWPEGSYLLVGKKELFDIENQVRVWSYSGHEQVESANGMCAFVVSAGEKNPGALVLARVPPPTLEQTLARAMKAPDFFVVKPGVTVKLNFAGLPDAQERAKAETTITKKLEELGMKTGASGSIELVATAEPGEEKEISYHGFGISPWKEYKVREYVTRLKFVYKGQVVWQTQGSSVPTFISLKEGETIEQVLRRSERADYSLFERVEFPKMLMKPMGPDGLGASKVSVAGIQ